MTHAWGAERGRERSCFRPLVRFGHASGPMDFKSEKRNEGQRDVEVRFAGVTFRPGHHLYADADGIITAETPLS